MGAVVKNPITQLAQASVPGPTSGLFFDESLARMPNINSKEIRDLSRFLPVIVLIHKSHHQEACCSRNGGEQVPH
jgi:hypothetical protein